MRDVRGGEDQIIHAGREWMRGRLDSRAYFALVRRSARPTPWWRRLAHRLRGRRT